MATRPCVCQEPGNMTRTHKELVVYLQVQSRAPEPASRRRSYKKQDTADPKERQHTQPEPGKSIPQPAPNALFGRESHSVHSSPVQVRGEGTELPDVFGTPSAGEQRRSKGKIQAIPISAAGSVSGLRDCILLSRLLFSLPAPNAASPGKAWKFAP